MMNVLLITSLVLAVSFTGIAAWRMRCVPESMSAMVYAFRGEWRWLWTVWLWAVTFTMAPSLIEAMDEEVQVFAFATIASLLFVGVWPLFDTDHREWHYALAIFAGITSQMCVLMTSPLWLLTWLAFPLIYGWGMMEFDKEHWYDDKGTFIAEAVCASAVYGALLTT